MGKASEVGNVFDLGQKYGKDFDLGFSDKEGNKQYPSMGCYGIGVSRVMGVIVEKFNDDRGIIWPKSVAPFMVNLVGLDLDDVVVQERAEEIYNTLSRNGIEILYDDRRDVSAGAKFADSDLIGIPYRLIVSKKTGVNIEVKMRGEKESKLMDFAEMAKLIAPDCI